MTIRSFQLKILKIVPDPDNYSIVLRFLGTTPFSSNMKSTLNSVINQIAKIYNLKVPPTSLAISNITTELLKDYLYEQFLTINSLYPDKKLIIVLDSIDQLNASDYTLDWFLDTLPVNIKMIYSTLSKYGGILDRLSTKRGLTEDNYVKIVSLDIKVSKVILNDWLQKGM